MRKLSVRALLVVVVALTLPSCAGNSGIIQQQRQDNYKKICDSWLNGDVNNLIRQWGTPQSSYQMPNGNRVITYQRASQTRTPVMTLPQTTTYTGYGNTVYQNQGMGMTIGGDVVTWYCNTSFEIDKADRIVFWRTDGNACVAD